MANIKGLTLWMAVTAFLWVVGCGLPYRCDTRPCWYDESRGVGAPYYDPNEPEPWKRRYYLGRDPANPKRVIRLYGATGYYPPSPYVYQPGSGVWTSLYQWSTIRPYVLPKCPHR